MLRLAKPAGFVIIIAPNLLSPIHCIKQMWRLARGKGGEGASPFGKTLLECLGIGLRNGWWLALKALSAGWDFRPRQPDLGEAADGDADSVWWCNPVDVGRFLAAHGGEVVQAGWGKSRWLGPYCSATILVVGKQGR